MPRPRCRTRFHDLLATPWLAIGAAYAALEGFELQRQAARQIFDDLLADVALAARWALSAFRVAAMDVPAEPERLSLKRQDFRFHCMK